MSYVQKPFWQHLVNKVAKNGYFAQQGLPFLAIFMHCQTFLSISGNPKNLPELAKLASQQICHYWQHLQ